MNEKQLGRLKSAGWKVGSAADFLELSADEAAYIELKLALAGQLRRKREEQQLTQVQLAKKIGSSQSRVAKMEKGDPTVSLDLLVKSLLALNATKEDIGRVIAEPKPDYG